MTFLRQSSRKPPGPISPLPPASSGPGAGPGQPGAVFVAEKHPLCIVRQLEAVGRRRETGLHRLHQIGGDDDDEVGLAALEAVRAEHRADDRNIADPRDLGDELLGGVLQQAGESEAFAAAELDRGFGAADGQGGDRDGGVLVSGTETSPMVESSLTSGRTRRLRWLRVDDRRGEGRG